MLDNRAQGNRRGLVKGIAVDAGAERGENDALDAMLFSEIKATLIGACQQPFILSSTRVDGANGMEDVTRGESASRCRDGTAGRAATDFATFFHDGWPTRAMNSAINTAAASQAAIGGVDDGVGLHLYNVAFEQRQCDTVEDAGRHK